MDLEEFKKQCPVIMETYGTHLEHKLALLEQGKFFQNHTFIFKFLSEREEKLLRLRCGMVTGKVETRVKVGAELGITGQRVCQLEANAFRKLKTHDTIKLLMTYTDDTFDYEKYKDFNGYFKSLLRQDIVKSIDTDSLKVVNDVDIRKLPLEIRNYRGATSRLYKGGIKTCGQLIEYLKSGSDFKEFGLGVGFVDSAVTAICGLVQDGYMSIESKEIRDDYLEHLTFVEPFRGVSTISKCDMDNLPDNLINTPIEDLHFSRRTFHCLKRNKINTLSDLIDYYNQYGSLKESIKNFGEICENEVMAELKNLGLIPKDEYELDTQGLKDSYYRPTEY